MNNNSSLMEKRYIKKNGSLSPTSPTKKAIFSEAVVSKSDVGEFQEGYFIMSTPDDQKMRRPNVNNYNKSSPQRRTNRPNNQQQQQQQQPNNLEDSSNQKPLKQQYTPKQQKYQQQSSSITSPPGLALPLEGVLLTPANITKITSYSQQDSYNNQPIDYSTPKKNTISNKQFIQAPQPQHNNFKQQQQLSCNNFGKTSSYSTSPPRSDSPKKGSSSPQSTCWAGGAFNNSPSPSSLPIPNFEDFQTQPAVVPDLQSMTFDLRRLLNITPTVSACSD